MPDLRESSTYQEILEEGRAEEREKMKRLILQLLQRRFGPMSEQMTARIGRYTTDQLSELGVALLDFNAIGDLERWLAEH